MLLAILERWAHAGLDLLLDRIAPLAGRDPALAFVRGLAAGMVAALLFAAAFVLVTQ
jgi:hypothetical protein